MLWLLKEHSVVVLKILDFGKENETVVFMNEFVGEIFSMHFVCKNIPHAWFFSRIHLHFEHQQQVKHTSSLLVTHNV